jgi:predicted  nucleic acid-binding Zn-ribbon protein
MPEGEQIGKGLYVKIGLDVSGILGGVGGVSIALNQSLELFSKFEGVAQGFVDLANNAALMGKEIKDNARDLGLSTTEFQQWTHTAIAAGSSAEEITGSIRMMSVRMQEAADPTSEMGKTLKALGVNVLDSSGKMRSMNDVLLDVFPALNALPEGFERNQAAMTLFGRGFTNIADLASLSREEIQQLIDQAPVFGEDKIEKLDAFNTKMNLLNEKLERSKVLVGEELIGSFTTWGNLIDKSLEQSGPLYSFFEHLNILLEMVAEGFTLLGGRIEAFHGLVSTSSPGFMNLERYDAALQQLNRDVLVMRDRFAHPENYEVDLSQATKEFTGLGKEAAKTSKEVQDLQRKMEDLYQSIIDAQLSTQEAELDNADLIEANNKLYKERALIDLQADPNTSGGQKYAERIKEIDKELERNILKINKNNQTINKDTTDIARAHEDLVAGMVAGDAEIVASMAARVETTQGQYAELDQLDMSHWQTATDLARVAYDTIIDYMVKAINFAGENPIIQNVILMSAEGANWTPGTFTPTSAEPLPTVDFSKVMITPSVTTQTENKSMTSAANKTVNITVNQTNTGVTTDADGMNRALGKIANLTGAGG